MAAPRKSHSVLVLPNGEEATINDHVYFAPPWSERDGLPYSIARIIEFVPSTAIKQPGGSSSRKKINRERHVRLSLFYRQSELSGRQPSDHRLLLAAIHTEVHPVSWLRAKCQVRHRDRIEDLVEWKRRPDCFWFQRLFDPWIKREYEMVAVGSVQNVPPEVKKTLNERYEFIVTEKEIVSDLTDSFRTCGTCDEWGSSLDSVKCETCKVHYHMSCVRPVLVVKPSKGYSWMCAPCIYENHRKAALAAQRNGHPLGNGIASAAASGSDYGNVALNLLPPGLATTLLTSPPSAGPRKAAAQSQRARTKDSARTKLPQVLPADFDRPDRTFRGWPFRYFGQYTVARDALDPDDRIFPRTAIRLGQRYQANVPTWEEQRDTREKYDEVELPERGLDDGSTSTLNSRPNEQLPQFIRLARLLDAPVPPDSIERYDRALNLFTASAGRGQYGAFDALRASDFEDFKGIMDLTAKELVIFEAQVDKWGSLEQHETAKLLSRKSSDLVRIYYRWRNGKLGQARRDVVKLGFGAKASSSRTKTAKSKASRSIVGGSSILGTHREMTPESDAEGSIWEEDRLKSAKPACSTCSSRKSVRWWKTPRSQVGEYLCDNCGSTYRRYGVAVPTKALLDGTRGSKREGTPMEKDSGKKLLKTNAQLAIETVALKLQPCILCRKTEPKTIARCKNCTFSIHPGCYGMPKEDVTPDWLCEPCSNENTLETALNPSCVLCPSTHPNLTRALKPRPKLPPDFDYLHAVKPTEGYKWVHSLCSTFVPDVAFSDAGRMRVVEGVMSLPTKRWMDRCDICNTSGGVVIDCSGDGCDRKFHASCGWSSNFRFGFEFMLPTVVGNRLSKKEIVTSATFKHAHGQMVAQCFCTGHPAEELEERQVFELFDYDGEIEQTALQLYVRTYKQVNIADSFGQFRKAKRIEAIMDAIQEAQSHCNPNALIIDTSTVGKAQDIKPDPVKEACVNCQVEFSPRWYDSVSMEPLGIGLGGKRVCHLCFFRRRAEAEAEAEKEREDQAVRVEAESMDVDVDVGVASGEGSIMVVAEA